MIKMPLLEAARVDLWYANAGIQSGDDGFTGVAGFHIQQAVEKILKAGLTYCGVPYKKIHDISVLLQMTEKYNNWLTEDLWNWIELSAPLLTSWENKPRYCEEGYLIALRTVTKQYGMAKELYLLAITLFENSTKEEASTPTLKSMNLL